MYSKFPTTSAEAARKVRDLLANRLTVNDAINLAKDCERAGLHDGATLDELMALLAPFAFSSHTDLWHAFKEGWLDKWLLSATVANVHNQANISLYGYDRDTVTFTLNRSF